MNLWRKALMKVIFLVSSSHKVDEQKLMQLE